jgi:uncharacterized membrane protein
MLLLLLHVLAGGLGLASGYVALYASKGAPAHRASGRVFVAVMLTMAVTGMLIAAIEGIAPVINIPSALLTSYLVITSLATVRRGAASAWIDLGALASAMAIGLACCALAVAAATAGGPEAGMAFPLVMFGGVAFAAAAGDRRVVRDGALRGAPRLKRHLWRMCFALFIASIAFFLGGNRVPAPFDAAAVRAAGVLLPIVAISYWFFRLRVRQPSRMPAGVSAPKAV